MKELVNKSSAFFRLEFWIATAVFVLVLFFHITDALNTQWMIVDNRGSNQGGMTVTYFIAKLVRYVALYLAFITLSFTVLPRLLSQEKIALNILLLISVYAIVSVLLAMTDTYLKSYLFLSFPSKEATWHFIYSNSFLYTAWLLLVFGFYSFIKYAGIFFLVRYKSIQSNYGFVTDGGLTAFILWPLIMFILLANNAERGFIGIWAILLPSAIALHWYALYTVIPRSLQKRKPFRSYLGKSILIVVLGFLPSVLLAMLIVQDADHALAITCFNAIFQLLITVPFSWFLFKRQMKGNEEVYALKTRLGQSTASFDFLRSQINPHFLFNALNTLYGTALQEGAERTGEGVQKLGDMMRFMLQENMQDKISLSREIDYLNNYISLQKLRTDPISTITIRTDIKQQLPAIQIAPMLLIPFVENAFKHGISFRELSHITITLDVTNNVLSFDVYNSRHQRIENDPELDKSGIGLPNVKQRLQLIYPSRHELVVRETAKDFFVHLTIQLS